MGLCSGPVCVIPTLAGLVWVMRILLNGKPHDAPDNATIAVLLAELGVSGRPCAAEVNREVVPRREHESRQLVEGDIVEVVTLVGGG